MSVLRGDAALFANLQMWYFAKMTSPQTQTFIDQWHRIFEENNPELMLPLIHEDIQFYSPAVYSPKHGKQIVFETLKLVFGIFEDYRVTDTWVKDREVLFEFETKVGKYTLQGIDRFRLDEDGKIIQMKVWIRPLTGLRELARTVAKHELERHLSGTSTLNALAIRTKLRTAKLMKSITDGLK